MSLDMTHEDAQAALAAEALDGLEAEAVRAHLAGCDECRRRRSRTPRRWCRWTPSAPPASAPGWSPAPRRTAAMLVPLPWPMLRRTAPRGRTAPA